MIRDPLIEYIDSIKKNPDGYCDKIRRLYLGIIEPIVKDQDDSFYYDPKLAHKFVKMCQGDIESIEQFNADFNSMPSGSNYERMKYLEMSYKAQGKSCGFVRQHTGEWYGKPLILVPYQLAYIFTKYGIRWRKGKAPEGRDDKLRFLETFMEVPRKNGKSTLEVSEALFSLFSEQGAEVYVSATTYKQARRIWDEALNVIESSPTLDSIFDHRVFPQAEIYFKRSKTNRIFNTSTFKVLPNNPSKQDGLNISHAIIDECHELPREVYTILKQGTSARNGMITQITTAGYLRGGLFDDQYEYANVILKGNGGSPSMLPIIYELDEGDDFMVNKACWFKANPALGIIKQVSYIEDQIKRSKTDLNTLADIKLKDFNIIGVEKSCWLTAEIINQESEYPTDESLNELNGSAVIGGVDLSRTGDCTACTILISTPQNKKIIAHNMYWVTQDFLDSDDCKRSGVPWNIWISRGLARIAGEHIIPSSVVVNWIMEEFEKHDWQYEHIGYDPYSSGELIQKLVELGFSSEKDVSKEDKKFACLRVVRQTTGTLTKPMEILRALLASKRLDYQNNPITKWMLSNVELVQDSHGMFMPDKKNKNRAMKIDGVATILDALVIFCENIDGYCQGILDGLDIEISQDKE